MSNNKFISSRRDYIKRCNNNENADEFYTPYNIIADEMPYYAKYFEGKTLYFNCDDGSKSNFYKYFKDNFAKYKLAKIISTGYIANGNGIKYEFDGENELITQMNGDGSYLSDESRQLLNQADIVITNPPFRKVRIFYEMLLDAKKDFIVVSSNIVNMLYYYAYFKRGVKIYNGHNYNYFDLHNEFNSLNKKCCWKSTLKTDGHKIKILTNKFADIQNKEWFDLLFRGEKVLNVNRTKDIPIDYTGYIATPITTINQELNINYDLCGIAISGFKDPPPDTLIKPIVNGKSKFLRFIIKITGLKNEEEK